MGEERRVIRRRDRISDRRGFGLQDVETYSNRYTCRRKISDRRNPSKDIVKEITLEEENESMGTSGMGD